jgi:alpha-1,2-rhamnosyltransferase
MVGTIEPKKGHIPVIESFERLWSEGVTDRDLVLVGRTGWLEKEVVTRIKYSPFFNEKLFWFDDLDDVDLYVAYRNARGLIFASYAEGFGIPIIEAGMSGLPIICYRTEVAQEVAGSFGLFYTDFAGLAAHVRALEDDAVYEREKNKLKAFTWPTWRETGYSLFDELKGLASGGTERIPSASHYNR